MIIIFLQKDDLIMTQMGTLIHICGGDRTGTTMLDLMIGNALDAFSCGEIYAWFRPHKAHHMVIKCRTYTKPCGFCELLSKVKESEVHSRILQIDDIRFVIDSSKELCWLIDSLRWAFRKGIQSFILLLWKDPMDHAFSYWKRGKSLKLWLKKFLDYYGRFLSIWTPFFSIRFAELIKDPAVKLSEI